MGSSLKWPVLGQNERSKRLKVDGLRIVDGHDIQKWMVEKAKTGREMIRDGPLLVEWPSTSIHVRQLWLKRPSSLTQDRSL